MQTIYTVRCLKGRDDEVFTSLSKAKTFVLNDMMKGRFNYNTAVTKKVYNKTIGLFLGVTLYSFSNRTKTFVKVEI